MRESERTPRFSCRPLGEAVSVPLDIETLWKLDRRAYGPHYWRATTSCSQRNSCFSQCPFSSRPRLMWPPIGLWFLPGLLLNVHLPGEEKTGQKHPVWRKGIEKIIFFLYIYLQTAHKNTSTSQLWVCVFDAGGGKRGNFKHEADKPMELTLKLEESAYWVNLMKPAKNMSSSSQNQKK